MRDIDSEETGDGPAVRPKKVAHRVNWVPTVVMLGLFFWWIVLAFFFYGRFPDLRDAARSIAYLLFAGVVGVGVPALAKQFAPKASPGLRWTGIALVYFALAVPLAFALFWSSYDAITPAPPRAAGQLPNVGSLIGRSQHDVVRILGAEKIVAKAGLPPSDVSDPSRPGGAKATRFVVYSLPDLNTLDARQDKLAARKAEGNLPVVQLGSVINPEKWGTDALVIVYYGADDRAVGVRADMSMRSALAALSNVTSQTVLVASGITPKAAVSMASSAVSEDATDAATTSAPVDAYWGSGSTDAAVVGYQLQIGGLANFLTARSKLPSTIGGDQGDITLVIAQNLTGPTDMLVANADNPVSTGASTDAQAADDSTLARHGADAFSGRTFWCLIVSKPFGTKEDADAAAKDINAKYAKGSPRFSVERSGHLSGLGDSDFWVVVYDVGYVYEDAARKAISAGHLPPTGVTIVQVTKNCGEYTFSSLVY